MSPTHFGIGDPIDASPVGPGSITDVTDAGYPQVNGVAVACLRRADGAVFDPYGHYKNGVPEKDTLTPSSV